MIGQFIVHICDILSANIEFVIIKQRCKQTRNINSFDNTIPYRNIKSFNNKLIYFRMFQLNIKHF